MVQQTTKPSNGPTLREHMTQLINALRKELEITWASHAREHSQHEAAHTREHAFAQTAIEKAAEMAKENKADANEWRATMNDREARFATKVDIAALAEKIDKLDESATHGADTKFATKVDIAALAEKIDKIERASLVATEREQQRTINEAENKRETERRTARTQWTVGLIVGLAATFGAILINTVIRLTTG